MIDGWANGGGVSRRRRVPIAVKQAAGLGLVVIVLAVVAVQSLQSCDPNLDLGPGKGYASQQLAVRVTPRTGLRPGQQVRVTSSAFGRGDGVAVTVCLRESEMLLQGVDACDKIHGSQFATDRLGRLAVAYRVPRVITVGRRAYDCASSLDRCILVAANTGDYNASGGTFLRFRAGLPLARLVPDTNRPQSLRLRSVVHPSGTLRAGQSVVIDAYGFVPGESLLTGWCSSAFISKGVTACDISQAFESDPLDADGYGHVRLTRTIPRRIDPISGDVVTCRSRPGACQFGIGASADLQRSALVPVTVRP